MGGQEGGGKGASQARWRGRARAGPPPPDTARADIEGSAPGPCQAGSRSAHWRRRGPGPRCASVRPWRRRGVGRLGGGGAPRPRAPASPPPARSAVIAGRRRCARVRLIAGGGATGRCGAPRGRDAGRCCSQEPPGGRQAGRGRRRAPSRFLGPGSARFPPGDFDSPPEVAPPPRARPPGARGVSARGLCASRPACDCTPGVSAAPSLRPTSQTVLVARAAPPVAVAAAGFVSPSPGAPAARRLGAFGLSVPGAVVLRLSRRELLAGSDPAGPRLGARAPGSGRSPRVLRDPAPALGASVSPGFPSVSLSPLSGFFFPRLLSPLRVSGCLSSTAVSLALRLLFSGFLLGLCLSASLISPSFSISLSRCLSRLPRVFSARHQCVSVSLGFSLSLAPQGTRSVGQRRAVALALSLSISLSPPDSVSVSFVPGRSPEHSRPHSGRGRPGLPRGRAHLVFSESGFCSQTNESGAQRTEPRVPDRARRRPGRRSPREGRGVRGARAAGQGR